MQLTLPIQLPIDETFASFYAAQNEQVVQHLKAILNQDKPVGLPLTLIKSATGIGKSHLLFALCHYADSLAQSAMYLDLSAVDMLEPSIFEGLETQHVICLDNIHVLAHSKMWEIALFDLINRVIEQANHFAVKLIMSCQTPLPEKFDLADLKSRLSWGTVFNLIAPSDEDKRHIVELRARQMGLRLSNSTYDYLLSHASRDLPSLIKLLGELDELSLTKKRNINVTLLREVLSS